MVNRMLIDAGHPEETRVVVISGNRVEEFDYEATAKKQIKGNIYLAKVTRVEPSLQAAFVDYGGNRHGFLPFGEIHPDYYRIPIADREALLAEEAKLKAEAAERDADGDDDADGPNGDDASDNGGDEMPNEETIEEGASEKKIIETSSRVEVLGGDEVDDNQRSRAELLRHYKIQEVIKRRQVMLVQVTKEERGNKGAALTTYLSLAGRYCVLMPNTARGGGISRKIANANDRRRLKKIVSELAIPEGMAVIVRTAGSQRSKAEIKRDYEYLLRLWNDIREKTLQSSAPALIHEEGDLIKRSIRDLYTREMDDILVEGEEGYKAAKGFMKSLMPSHARKVQAYDDTTIPLFHRYQVEDQLDAIHESTVQLRSGGYVVLNQTEALVAIDVNSGKATRERHIEETALKTNLEAAEEVARQLRLRDLAGLIVIDFIDMEETRHNRQVENKLKEAMKHDRARIQLGRISPFGLLEMSRQRLRPSLFESSTTVCPRCGGSGHVRATDTSALHVLRALEDEGIKRGAGEITVHLPSTVALFLLNQKRSRLVEIEQRYGFHVEVATDNTLIEPDYRIERRSTTIQDREAPEQPEKTEPAEAEAASESDGGGKRRRRGGRKRKEETGTPQASAKGPAETAEEAGKQDAESDSEADGQTSGERPGDDSGDAEKVKKRRRRGKRGGRRRSKRRQEDGQQDQTSDGGESDGGEPDGGEPDGGADKAAANDEQPAAPDQSEKQAETEAKAKPKRTRRPRKKVDAQKADATDADTGPAESGSAEAGPGESAAPAVDESPASGTGDSAAEAESEGKAGAKPKRARKPRKKPVEKAPKQPATEGGEASAKESSPGESEPVGPADGDEKKRPESERPESELQPANGDAGSKDQDKSGKPRRRGWWNRVVN